MTRPAWRVVPAEWFSVWGVGKTTSEDGSYTVDIPPPDRPDYDAMAVAVWERYTAPWNRSNDPDTVKGMQQRMSAALRGYFEGQP